jgi:hypothetical protein
MHHGFEWLDFSAIVESIDGDVREAIEEGTDVLHPAKNGSIALEYLVKNATVFAGVLAGGLGVEEVAVGETFNVHRSKIWDAHSE